MKELICIVCPKGCRLLVDEEKGYHVCGNACPRGEAYGKEELQDPKRVVTSTVRITGALHRRLPVKTSGPVRKALVFQTMQLLEGVEVASPVKRGQIILPNILGTGVDVVSTKDM